MYSFGRTTLSLCYIFTEKAKGGGGGGGLITDGAFIGINMVYLRSGGVKVLGKLPVPGRPANFDEVGQGPIALAVGAGGGCLDIFSLVYHFSFLSPSLWETA